MPGPFETQSSKKVITIMTHMHKLRHMQRVNPHSNLFSEQIKKWRRKETDGSRMVRATQKEKVL